MDATGAWEQNFIRGGLQSNGMMEYWIGGILWLKAEIVSIYNHSFKALHNLLKF